MPFRVFRGQLNQPNHRIFSQEVAEETESSPPTERPAAEAPALVPVTPDHFSLRSLRPPVLFLRSLRSLAANPTGTEACGYTDRISRPFAFFAGNFLVQWSSLPLLSGSNPWGSVVKLHFLDV